MFTEKLKKYKVASKSGSAPATTTPGAVHISWCIQPFNAGRRPKNASEEGEEPLPDHHDLFIPNRSHHDAQRQTFSSRVNL